MKKLALYMSLLATAFGIAPEAHADNTPPPPRRVYVDVDKNPTPPEPVIEQGPIIKERYVTETDTERHFTFNFDFRGAADVVGAFVQQCHVPWMNGRIPDQIYWQQYAIAQQICQQRRMRWIEPQVICIERRIQLPPQRIIYCPPPRPQRPPIVIQPHPRPQRPPIVIQPYPRPQQPCPPVVVQPRPPQRPPVICPPGTRPVPHYGQSGYGYGPQRPYYSSGYGNYGSPYRQQPGGVQSFIRGSYGGPFQPGAWQRSSQQPRYVRR